MAQAPTPTTSSGVRPSPILSRNLARLQWPLFGSISDIRVAIAPDKQFDTEPYIIPATETTEESLHDIAELPISNPPVASISVKSGMLAEWEVDWPRMHNGEYEFETADLGYCPECGTKAFVFQPLEVKAAKYTCVSVGEYVQAVHPWLLGLKIEIIRGMEAGCIDLEGRDKAELDRRIWVESYHLGGLEFKKDFGFEWETRYKTRMQEQFARNMELGIL